MNVKTELNAETIARLANAKAKGKRPEYFDDPMQDLAYSVTLTLVSELAVARERIDTLERLLAAKGILKGEEVENYIPSDNDADARQNMQMAYTSRVFRPIQQAIESLNNPDLSMREMAEELGKAE